LLEVLDPEQNNSFADHYLEVPFDLSKVLFIATANTLETIPAPLRDRMEILQIPSYTLEEKAPSPAAHLLAKQLEAHGLADARVELTDAALDHVIRAHTREAGVRSLEKRPGRRVPFPGGGEGRRNAGRAPQGRRGRARVHSSGRTASSRRCARTPAFPAWRRGWPGRRWAARCCTSRR